MTRPAPLLAGLALLALLWSGGLAAVLPQLFTSHMVVHMGVVAVAAPLVALGFAGSRWDPSVRLPRLFNPVVATVAEFVIVWGWHAPALHEAARASPLAYAAEQASFLAGGLLVWSACLGSAAGGRAGRSLAGALGLLVTSMHMTLLGALLAFATRPLYGAICLGGGGTAPVADQQQGGIVMLLVGGVAYLAGGVALVARVLFPAANAPAENAPQGAAR